MDVLLEAVTGLDWVTQLSNPTRLMRSALDEQRKNELPSMFKKFWLFPILLSFTLDGILFYVYDIDFESHPLFIGLYILCITFKLFFDALFLYAILWLVGSRPAFGVVCACYSVFVVFSPILSVSSIPATYHQYSLIQEVKAQHLDAINSWLFYRDHVQQQGKTINQNNASVLESLSSIIEVVSYIVQLIASVFVAQGLSESLAADRFKTYIAVCITSWVSIIPRAPFVLSQMLMAFALMK